MSTRSQRRRVGIFGGTFDPPHVGHLLAAGDAAERLGLDVVLWVPVGTQPHKPRGPEAAGEPRLRMVELTVAGDSRFAAESWEVTRAGLSFTVDTLEEIRSRDPDAELFLLLGEDSWRSFPRWREPGRIREIATVAVLARAGGEQQPADGADRAVERNRSAGDRADDAVEGGRGAQGDEPIRLETRRVDVSATEVRERVREGLSIRGFVSDAVERYITEQKLYR